MLSSSNGRIFMTRIRPSSLLKTNRFKSDLKATPNLSALVRGKEGQAKAALPPPYPFPNAYSALKQHLIIISDFTRPLLYLNTFVVYKTKIKAALQNTNKWPL